jgi:hypothetical protein
VAYFCGGEEMFGWYSFPTGSGISTKHEALDRTERFCELKAEGKFPRNAAAYFAGKISDFRAFLQQMKDPEAFWESKFAKEED